MTQLKGRYCTIHNEQEVKNLEVGMDFREPKYRREVFLRFYEFHLKYRSHPGGVYFAFPWLSNYYNQDKEQKLWIAFINGCTQNIVTSSMIFERYPELSKIDIEDLENWWPTVQSKYRAGSGWDWDRKYFKFGKTGFPACVASYKKAVDKFGGSQEEMFGNLCVGNNIYENFEKVWDFIRNNFLSFGRLSTFSYCEYLRIQGIPIDCNDLFLYDIKGSKSHRNGLCKVLGRDDLDWDDTKYSVNPNFVGYEKETIDWIKDEAEILLLEAKQRIAHHDVSYFTLESTLCCYKGWHRYNRRYPNIYNDMFRDRIVYAESEWGRDKFNHFWQMRKDCLPEYLRVEDHPSDPGLVPLKQNHYRETGEVIMMWKDYPCFSNSFNSKYYDNPLNLEKFYNA